MEGNALGERRGLKGDAVLRGLNGCVDPGEVGTTAIGRMEAPLLDGVVGVAGKGGNIPLDETDGDGGGWGRGRVGGGAGGGMLRCCLEDGVARDFGVEVVGKEAVERGVPGIEGGRGNVAAVAAGVDTVGVDVDATSGEAGRWGADI